MYPDGCKVRLGDAITPAEVDVFFVSMLQTRIWGPIAVRIPHWEEMDDAMRSALCSFAYNLGPGFYGADAFDTISACLRQKHWQDVPKALMLYVNPGSSVEAGLRRRRDAEGDLWRQGLEQLAGPATREPPIILEAITETFLKKDKLDSSQLAPHQLVPVESSRQWKIEQRLERDGNAQKVQLAYGAGQWWIHLPHWRRAGEAAPAAAASAGASAPSRARPAGEMGGRDLKVPYLSQLDKRLNPYGSCNVTCVAMCLY